MYVHQEPMINGHVSISEVRSTTLFGVCTVDLPKESLIFLKPFSLLASSIDNILIQS